MRLLCLSNGHGEDAIALRILQALQHSPIPPDLAVLPLVGEGHAFQESGIPIIGTVKQMPSGGFVYQDGRQLVRDVQGGLVQLTRSQLKTIRTWAKAGGAILAVGDIVPLLFAWWSGAPYAFIGTAKSEYYLRDEAGVLPRRTWFEKFESFWGSVYLPWERWLMSHPRCKAVFPRDSLTTQTLHRWSIPAFDLGNPMMDGLEERMTDEGGRMKGGMRDEGGGIKEEPRTSSTDKQSPSSFIPHPSSFPHPQLTFVLLPGSRAPEAQENWAVILRAVGNLVLGDEQPQRFLAAIAPSIDLATFRDIARSEGWRETAVIDERVGEPETITLVQSKATLTITRAFVACLHEADVAIAMAGTATEQFVGLGKPAIILPGRGPQFTPRFAEAQTRLLGPSVILVEQPGRVATVVRSLLQDPDRLQLIAENGRRRMGNPGAAQRIATCLQQNLLT